MTLHQFLARSPSWPEWLLGGASALVVTLGAGLAGADALAQAITFTSVVVGFFALVFLQVRRGAGPSSTASAIATAHADADRGATRRDVAHRGPSLLALLFLTMAIWTAALLTEAADLGTVLAVAVHVGAFLAVSIAFAVHERIRDGRSQPST